MLTFSRYYIFLLFILTVEKVRFPLMFMNFSSLYLIFCCYLSSFTIFHENNMTENIACIKRNQADTITIDKYFNKQLHKHVACLLIINLWGTWVKKVILMLSFTRCRPSFESVIFLVSLDKYGLNLGCILRVTPVTCHELCPHNYFLKSLVYAAIFC